MPSATAMADEILAMAEYWTNLSLGASRSAPDREEETPRSRGWWLQSRADRYRARAADCERKAGQAWDVGAKRQLYTMARHWRQKAEQEAAAERLAPLRAKI
jgi:hypothetical protein